MGGPSGRSSIGLRRWHRTIETYTPDGAVGRIVLAAVSSTVAVFGFWIGVVGLMEPGFLSTLLGVMGLSSLLAATVLTVVVQWPVYLSLIGNVASAAEYAESKPSLASAPSEESPNTRLKRQYAEGEISQVEFERRLDDLLAVGDRVGADDSVSDRRSDLSGQLRNREST